MRLSTKVEGDDETWAVEFGGYYMDLGETCNGRQLCRHRACLPIW